MVYLRCQYEKHADGGLYASEHREKRKQNDLNRKVTARIQSDIRIRGTGDEREELQAAEAKLIVQIKRQYQGTEQSVQGIDAKCVSFNSVTDVLILVLGIKDRLVAFGKGSQRVALIILKALLIHGEVVVVNQVINLIKIIKTK